MFANHGFFFFCHRKFKRVSSQTGAAKQCQQPKKQSEWKPIGPSKNPNKKQKHALKLKKELKPARKGRMRSTC